MPSREGSSTRAKASAGTFVSLRGSYRCISSEILLITDKFGLPLFSAPAGSLSIFSELPQAVKIWHVFVLYWVIRLFIAAADALIILRISKKTESLSAAVLINSAILVLPVGAMLIAL